MALRVAVLARRPDALRRLEIHERVGEAADAKDWPMRSAGTKLLEGEQSVSTSPLRPTAASTEDAACASAG